MKKLGYCSFLKSSDKSRREKGKEEIKRNEGG
jgi:hypothetical protein